MVVPSALVVVVICMAIIVAGIWRRATVSPVAVTCLSVSCCGSVFVKAALVVGSAALPLIVPLIGPLGGVVIVMMAVLLLIVRHGDFLKIL